MSIIKIAFSDQFRVSDIMSVDAVKEETEIVDRFKSVIAALRQEQERQKVGVKIAPKLDDFLIAHCVQMHAAEASLLDDTGEFRKSARGEPVRGHFEAVKDSHGHDSVRWVSPDGIKMYKNANSDIFPEEDLIKSHKEWVGKPLCKDHVSSSVDGIRGIILDTFYEPKFKRVHALFALDKKNYPDLARKVEAGYATNVSMGTAVGRSICTECANVATSEAEYCHHVRSRANYGEINKDLRPIELSLVVTGADPKAKIKTVLAGLNNYFVQKTAALAGEDVTVEDMEPVLDTVPEDTLTTQEDKITASEILDLIRSIDLEDVADSDKSSLSAAISELPPDQLIELSRGLKGMNDPALNTIKSEVANKLISSKLNAKSALDVSAVGRPTGTTTQPNTGDLPATGHNSAGETLNSDIGKDPTSLADKIVGVDRTLPDPNSGITTASDNSSEVKRLAMLNDKEIPMTFAELRKRAEARKLAYHQGTEDPAKLPYKPMGDADKIRETMDKQMVGKELDTSGNIPAEDAKVKEMVQRASLEERRVRRAKLLAEFTKQADEVVEMTDSTGKKVKVKKSPDGKMETLKADDGAVEKKAYFQGTEEPTPGKVQYPLMGEPHDKMRAKDKQMSGQGMEPGSDGMHPGYGESDESVKRRLQRLANLRARLVKSAAPGASQWQFFSGDKEVLRVKASAAYETGLDQPVENTAQFSETGKDLTADQFFKTEAYAREVMKFIRTAGLEKAAAELGGEMPEAPAAPEAAPAAETAPVAPPEEDASKDKVSEAVATIESALEEIRDATKMEDLKQVDVPTEAPAPAPVAPVTASFRTQMLKVQASLAETADELNALQAVDAPAEVVSEALADAYTVASAAADLLDKFAAKKAKKAPAKKKHMEEEDEHEEEEEKPMKAKKKPMKKKAEELAEVLAARAAAREELVARAMEDMTSDEVREVIDELDGWDKHTMMAKDKGDVEGPLNKAEEKEVEEIAEKKVDHELGEHVDEMHVADDLMSRKAWRRDLLAKVAGQWNSTYEEVRKGPGPKVEVDAKVSDDLNKVETLAETKAKMEESARAEPRNVRMAAESLDRLVRSGVVTAGQIDELVAKGAVDSEAAKYWREYFGQVEGGREFANELTKEFKQKTASLDVKAATEEHDAKMMRAYNLSLEAQERGVIPKSRVELHRFATNLAKLPAEQFEAMKNMINQARKPEEQVKTAAPVVGMNYDGKTEATPRSTSEISTENLARLFF